MPPADVRKHEAEVRAWLEKKGLHTIGNNWVNDDVVRIRAIATARTLLVDCSKYLTQAQRANLEKFERTVQARRHPVAYVHVKAVLRIAKKVKRKLPVGLRDRF